MNKAVVATLAAGLMLSLYPAATATVAASEPMHNTHKVEHKTHKAEHKIHTKSKAEAHKLRMKSKEKAHKLHTKSAKEEHKLRAKSIKPLELPKSGYGGVSE